MNPGLPASPLVTLDFPRRVGEAPGARLPVRSRPRCYDSCKEAAMTKHTYAGCQQESHETHRGRDG